MQSMRDKLQQYLQIRWSDATSVKIENLVPILGGFSKQTWSFDAVVEKNQSIESHPLILRMDEPQAVALMQNSRENEHILINRILEKTTIPVPRSLFVEMNRDVFGEPAMLMERLSGEPQPGALFADPARQGEVKSIARQLCEQLAALHLTDAKVLNSDGRFSDPTGIGIQVDTWDHYLDGTLAYAIANYPNIAYDVFPIHYDALLHLRRSKPRPLPLVFLHGELNPMNLIYKDGKLIGIIDWEMARVGDPREDLAWLQSVESMLGTKFFASVDFTGGLIGYYNHLTGFNITQSELDYFAMLATVTVQRYLLDGFQRRFQGKHHEIKHVYMSQLMLPAFWINLGKSLNYPSPSQS